MFCPKCGNSLAPNVVFCPRCGASLTGNRQRAQVQPVQSVQQLRYQEQYTQPLRVMPENQPYQPLRRETQAGKARERQRRKQDMYEESRGGIIALTVLLLLILLSVVGLVLVWAL